MNLVTVVINFNVNKIKIGKFQTCKFWRQVNNINHRVGYSK